MPTSSHGRRAASALAIAAMFCLGTPAQANEADAAAWPSRPVRLIIPYAAGGPTDAIARLLADAMSQRLPQRVMVESRSGAGGTIAGSMVAKSAPDGYTLMLSNTGHAVTRALYSRLDYDPERDLVPVTIISESPMVLLVPSASPYRSLADLIAAARATPGRLTYGTSGGGGALQLASLLLLRSADVRMTEVPYRGSAPAALDLAAGTLDMLYDAAATGFRLARGGQARALAVSTAGRSPVMPEVPTVGEAGNAGATFSNWLVLLAPSGVSPSVIARINRETVAALAAPELRSRMAEVSGERVVANTPAEASRFVATEFERWGRVLREAGVRAQ